MSRVFLESNVLDGLLEGPQYRWLGVFMSSCGASGVDRLFN